MACRAQLVITTGLRRTDYVGKLAAARGLACIVDTDYQEVNFGLWEGLTWREIETRFPEQAQQWLDEPLTMQFPGGEGMSVFIRRIHRAWARTLARPESTIAIVGHSGSLAHLLRLITGDKDLRYLGHGQALRFEVNQP